MNNTIWIICCILGTLMIGFFAKDLDSGLGVVLYTIGVFLLSFSIGNITKNKNKEK